MTKYRKGKQINSLEELANCKFIYWRDRLYHTGWFMSWQMRYAKLQIDKGLVFKAEPKAHTFIEWLRLDNPEKTEQQIAEIVEGYCPFVLGYEEVRSCPIDVQVCSECWERRIREIED